MSDTVIEVENLSKKYIIGHQKQERYTALRDVIADGAKSFWRSLSGGRSGIPENKEEFWALKDVSFEVKQGECIGIIGRNGAGKSTLLKILSRITEPTTGRIKIRGRVASLLEVGTGFHPELTGRENIFLNGSILGMSRAEIKAKFDEIVDFAEVERFLDTPVKFYSSGMYVRLAFAVASHLEPEILIVDEVLAVGDAAFQKKCLGKMGDVAEKEGRTVLFVSHNMTAVQSLCGRVMLLANGEVKYNGDPLDAINDYLHKNECSAKAFHLSDVKLRNGKGELYFSDIQLMNLAGKTIDSVSCGDPLLIRLHFLSNNKSKKFKNCRIGISIRSFLGASIILSTEMVSWDDVEILAGDHIDFNIPRFPFTQGTYFMTLFAESNGILQDSLPDQIQVVVDGGDFYGFGKQCPQGHEGKHVLINFSFTKGTILNGNTETILTT
ncbi:MAG: ABC transporter ATP-binding protein [Snowella sp.]|nr:ABC transporter ATP-binding protein [Snowella sp.]